MKNLPSPAGEGGLGARNFGYVVELVELLWWVRGGNGVSLWKMKGLYQFLLISLQSDFDVGLKPI